MKILTVVVGLAYVSSRYPLKLKNRHKTSSCSPLPFSSSKTLIQHHLNDMESLSETQWDVVIEGTGLQQSLLAL